MMFFNGDKNGASALADPPLARVVQRNGHCQPATATATALPVAILGIPFDNVKLAEAADRIQTMIESRESHYVVTANVDFLVQAARDAELRNILVNAHLVLCDGTPLVWASRWLGNPLPERVAGADLVPELIRRAAAKRQRLFFLGATPEANADAAANVREQFPGAVVAGHYSPPFRPLDEMDNADIIERVRQARPDLLFVAFGCPKAEKWIAANYRALGVPVVIGVGATIDFLAGRVKRAPLWMQRCGAEWVFRLCQEPRRLSRRYADDLWHFLRAFAAQVCLMRFPIWAMGCERRRPREIRRWDSAVWQRASRLFGEPFGWRCLRAPSRFDAKAVRRSERLWDCTARHCVLDMSEVRFIDSTGVALLLRLRKKLRAAGKQLVLLSPSRIARWTLRLMGVEEISEHENISAVPERESVSARAEQLYLFPNGSAGIAAGGFSAFESRRETRRQDAGAPGAAGASGRLTHATSNAL